MAKFNPTLGDISGKIAGNCFSHNTYGAYIRLKVTPVNPQSVYQNAIRMRFSNFSSYWQSQLTDGTRQSWTDYAQNHPVLDRFGKSIVLSGIAMYQKINGLLSLFGASTIDDPPALEDQPSILTSVVPTVAHTGPAASFTFTDGMNPTTKQLGIYVAFPVSPARVYVANQFKFCAYTGNNPASPVNFLAPFQARWGVPAAGATGWLRIVEFNPDSAKLSPPYDVKFTVGA